jgi:hypothetical protein
MTRQEGFFTFYWEESTGKIWLEIDQWDKEFLYVNSLPGGLGSNDIGLDRGQLFGERIVYFNKVGNKVLLIQPNYQYRALTQDANEARAIRESFAQSVLGGFEVKASEGNKVLIDFTDFLLRDAHGVVDRLKGMKQGNYRLDAARSAIYPSRTKNFPLNSEFEATITFIGNEAGNYLNTVVPSTEAFTVRMHHSLIQLPDNAYKTRVFDPRAGYFEMSYFDYSTPVDQAISKKFITRHRLQKKNPNAALSEAVKPIVYYLDNGTPEPIRSALLDGAKWWNQAFEAAGYKDAFQVKILPDDADPMDVRYNVIQWVHRSTRGWSYGASVIDPRTGEILKGHVSLGSLRVRQDFLIAEGLIASYQQGKPVSPEMLKMALARLRQLSAHEIGHTLGLAHNYAASINNRASVMDYPHPTVQLNNKGELDLSNAYDDKIGDWDKVAIAFGYQDFPKGTDERKELEDMLQNALKRGLYFISDRDARAMGGAHPTAHLWDNGKDITTELDNVLKVRQKALDNFSEKNIKEGVPLAMLEDVLVPIYNYHRYQVEAVAKLVGGLDYRYALRGDGQPITQFLPKETQQKALESVLKCISPEVLTLPERIIQLIPPRPIGYESTRELFPKRTGLTFDPIAAAEACADLPLALLLHHERANRLVELKARNPQNLSLEEVLSHLSDKTWKMPRLTGLAKEIQLQTEQLILTHLLVLSMHENASWQVKAIVTKHLQNLKTWMEAQKNNSDIAYSAHLDYALERMKAPDKAKVNVHKAMPPGAPIGCCVHGE